VSAEPVTLFAGSPSLVPFKPTVTDAALPEVEKQVRRYIDSCVRGEIKPTDCPFWDSTNLHTRPIAAQIIKYPTPRIEVGSLGELKVTSAQPGEYEYTASGSEPRRITRPFGAGGRLKVDGVRIVFTRL